MKVFLAGASLKAAYGGPAVSVPRLAAALAEEGVEVGLWAPDGSAGDLSPKARPRGLRLLSGRAGEALDTFGRPDVIHDNGLWLPHNHRLAALARARRIPRVVSPRGMLEPWAFRHKAWKKQLAWRLYQRRDLLDATLLHATSQPEGENLRGLGLELPVATIPNGVDVPPAASRNPAGRARGQRLALFLGRIYPVKGLPMLIEAWGSVRPAGWRLQIAGPDEAGHRAVVERRIHEQRLGDVVSFSGPVEGAAKSQAYADADLFILPSHSESFGMAVAEALAHGVPVLTTTAVPWPSLEANGCGWRTSPDVRGLTEGLRLATAEAPQALRSMGDLGRRLVASEFGWPRAARALLDAYRGHSAPRPASPAADILHKEALSRRA